ncbi:GbsR/MarR family transcriptional regulator [Mycetocola zhujimingii]|uniref:Transcriptional regulator n=1 Tax=Mycetocola zhujimingii TaxID=2079792 RepID=A0A2U1TCH5_9MICO|nr:MarR family transcriptional regulator [Mycetocola zhujimingii]AWB87698.1 transcriptional regulator [Mycetocola zhujimingii]PWC06483.1 transcriptional regulator [Mycetocola zhujimingii]
MTDTPDADKADAATASGADADEREMARRQFAEDLSIIWEGAGTNRMDGRVLGYLMIMDRPYISSADLAAALHASAGAVSMATRRLLDTNFIRRHSVPGDRSHYFRAEEDPWGSFLATEKNHFDREIEVIEDALELLGPDESAARVRLTNGRDYLHWIHGYHHKMLADWQAHKHERDARASAKE